MYRPDTSPEVQEVYDQMIRNLSEEERFLKGISAKEMKIRIFERIYRDTFNLSEKEKIISFLQSCRG